MTKWEVKEYLLKIYDVPVKKVRYVCFLVKTNACMKRAAARTQQEVRPMSTSISSKNYLVDCMQLRP